MSAKRFDLGGDCDGESGRCRAEMVQVSNGDFVSYEDYAELEAKLEELETKIARAKEELG